MTTIACTTTFLIALAIAAYANRRQGAAVGMRTIDRASHHRRWSGVCNVGLAVAAIAGTGAIWMVQP